MVSISSIDTKLACIWICWLGLNTSQVKVDIFGVYPASLIRHTASARQSLLSYAMVLSCFAWLLLWPVIAWTALLRSHYAALTWRHTLIMYVWIHTSYVFSMNLICSHCILLILLSYAAVCSAWRCDSCHFCVCCASMNMEKHAMATVGGFAVRPH